MVASLLATPGRSGGDPTGADREASVIRDVIRQLQRDFEERDSLYADIDDVLFQQLRVKIPDAYKDITQERRSSLAVEMTNTIVSAWTVNKPQTQFLPVAFGDAAMGNATLREHFFDASWERQVREAGGNVLRRYAHAVCCKGEGVLKTVQRTKSAWAAYTAAGLTLQERLSAGDLARLDTDAKDRLYAASADELKRAAPYPIQTTDVPPEQFYYHKTDGVGITLGVEVKEVPYLETLVKYGASLDRNGRVVPVPVGEARPFGGGGGALPSSEWRSVMSNTPTLTLIEYWTFDVVRYLLVGPGQITGGTGTVVKKLRHGYGDPRTKALRGPYFHTLGSVTSSRQPGRSGLGVLFGYLTLFPMLDTLRTIQQTNAIMTGWAAFKRNAPQNAGLPAPFGEDGLPEAKEAQPLEPGMIYPYDISAVEQPQAGRALGEAMADIRQELQGILPPVLQGVTAESDSGYEYNQAVYLARTKWSAPIQNIEQTLSDRVGFESWLIENRVGETVYAWGEPAKSDRPKRSGGDQGWLGIGPDDLNGVHNYRVRLNPETPSNEVIKIRSHKEMVDAGFEDIDDARTDLGKNPDEVERAILFRKFKDQDWVQQALVERTKQYMGIADQQALAAAQAAVAKADGGQQPAAGGFAAGAPNVFQPGQNGQPLAPTAPGPSAAPGGGQGLPANPSGVTTPANSLPLPGQGPVAPGGGP